MVSSLVVKIRMVAFGQNTAGKGELVARGPAGSEFILRYAEEKAPITGIISEPWHFRYVGTEVSMAMKDTGLCLEEYLGAPAVKDSTIE